jgi:hypothetical protein
MDNPKLFISYSWSSPEHEQKVLTLATQLVESGVDVILDKWYLKEGHDTISFMEKMVTDSEIKKVAIICDQIYSEKADGRSGGVGTETQIISREVYEKENQEKFVAVVMQKDGSNKPFLPTYYKSRIYIDLSEADTFNENFEKLLRWIFDKPLYIKPEIGKGPSFLENSEKITLGTTAIYGRCSDAIRNNKSSNIGLIEEYLNLFSENLERFRITTYEGEFDEVVISNIEQFVPYRNEFIQLIIMISQYTSGNEAIEKIHRFFERTIKFLEHPESVTTWKEWDYDNFKFIINELFLYTVAILVKYEKFNLAAYLINQHYYISHNSEYGRNVMVDYCAFRVYLKSFEFRNQRLKLRRLSLHADILKQRCNGFNLEFRHLMQADFVLFLYSELHPDEKYYGWWPTTLVYLSSFQNTFEIFARSISKDYFEKVKVLLGINSIEELKVLFEEFQKGSKRLPRWEFHTLNPSVLVGIDKLETKP